MRYKSSEKAISGSLYICSRVFGALGQFGKLDPNIQNYAYEWKK